METTCKEVTICLVRFNISLKKNEVYAFYQKRQSDFPITEVDILAIQNALLNGSSKFRILREQNCYHPGFNVPLLSLELELADEFIIGTLGGILMKAFGQSSFFQIIVLVLPVRIENFLIIFIRLEKSRYSS